jgi:hypothetical protein
MKRILPIAALLLLSAPSLSAQAPVSHAGWDALLKKHVSPEGRVNYVGFRQDKAALQQYLDLLKNNPPAASASRNDKLAFWINAYNAFTVKLIVDNYPLKSIRDLGEPWDRKFIQIGPQILSLNDIEHTIIRKQFEEPRIHFAVNCASRSCPELRNEAYSAARLSEQLDQQARRYLNNPAQNQLQPSQAALSQLFSWYQGDFTKQGSLTDFINRYSKVKLLPSAAISYRDYDWSLNQ